MVNENVRMVISLPTKRISVISQWKTFITVLSTRWRRKPAGIEITSLSPYVYIIFHCIWLYHWLCTNVICMYVPFILRVFFVFALFSVSMCVSCFFVMGGQQRWANASTGSLPLWQLMCMIYVMYLVDKLSLSLVSSPKTKSSRQIRLKCSIWLIETGIGDPVVPDDVEESATSGISELTSLSASWTVGDLASRRLLLCSWGGHSPTLHPSVCPSVSICPIHLARYLPGAAAPGIDVPSWCTIKKVLDYPFLPPIGLVDYKSLKKSICRVRVFSSRLWMPMCHHHHSSPGIES